MSWLRLDAVRGGPRAAAQLLLAGLMLGAGSALAQQSAPPPEDSAATSESAPPTAETGDAQPPEADSAAAPGESDGDALPVTRFEAEIAFERLFTAADYDAAVGVGERLVELTIEQFGAESVEAGNAYAALGAAQREAGEYEAAEESFLRAVELMRGVGGPYSEHLIEPLVGLGDTYHADEQYLEAVSAYNEAQSVNRRVFGLLNEDQIPLLDRMTESFYEMEEFEQADEQQLAALQLIERVYEPHAPETLAAVYKYADWLQRNNRFTEARERYTRAIRTIREHYGEDDVRLVEPLRLMANSYRRQRAAHGQGLRALNDAREILSSQPEPDPLQLATVLRDLGDWHTAFTNVGSDNAEYRQAWELLGDVENGDVLREDWFSGIHYVLREPHSSRGLSREPGAVQGSVTVRLDIDEQGRSENVVVVESDPADFEHDAFVRHVQGSRFRPHMEDGVVVPARRLGLRFTFMYLPEDLEDD